MSRRRPLALVVAAWSSGCSGGGATPPADAPVVLPADAPLAPPDAALTADAPPGPAPRLAATLGSTRFYTADHMRASIEMQISGEPFAQLLGYNLAGFNRSALLTDRYTDPSTGHIRVDPLGYALAVESYEYSKQAMNNLSFESGAGLSLQFGPVVNPPGAMGDRGYQLLDDRLQTLAAEAGAAGLAGRNYVVAPAPTANPLNYYGWPGFWPVFAEFASFDPAIAAVAGYSSGCSLTRGNVGRYGGVVTFSPTVGLYECDYNSLNLAPRDAHVEKILSPDALGYASWKQGLWITNYWGTLHDLAGNQITVVDPNGLTLVGQTRNAVIGRYPDPADPTGATQKNGVAGTYLGDVPIEGWQGLVMLEENDNKAALLLGNLVSRDGATLAPMTVTAADGYAYDSPLAYFPAQVAVTETPTATDPSTATKYFPRPTAFTIADGKSRLRDLAGLIGGFAVIFNIANPDNAEVGGSLPMRVTFDGDPFPSDDGQADGENTMHDRALGVMKVALVDLDRLHLDAAHQVLVDEATVAAGVVTRGHQVTTVELAESIVALRNAYRALNGSLQLYSNDTPDTLGAPGALDGTALSGAPFTGGLSAHLIALIRLQADFLAAKLVGADGKVANGYDLAADAADASATDLAAETAALRGLLEAYLATSDTRYRQLAILVYADLGRRFWVDDLRVFATTAGETARFEYTPIRFGLTTGSLRQYWKLVASQPGRETEAATLLARLVRLHKLVLNGWDDANQDGVVQFPDECTGAGLELGERALTGELANPLDDGDRDHDCVREISAVGLPAALGASVVLVPR
jgi:hypothetical protein